MDELTKYLQTSEKYDEQELIEILDKKIIITSNHIRNIKFHHINVNINSYLYEPIYTNNII